MNRIRYITIGLILAAVAIGASGRLSAQAVPLDSTVPEVKTNREAKDVQTKLSLMEQEQFSQSQGVTFLTFLLQYGDHIRVQRFFYASGKDLVPGYVFTPLHLDKAKRYPAIVLVHGGFHAELDWRWFDLIEAAVAKGYVVFFPEYHGSAGYGEGIYKNNYGTTDIADVLAGTEYLVKSRPYVDPARLAVVGHSRGGMLTLLAIEQAPKKFKAAVDIAGLSDFVAFMAYKPDWRRAETATDERFGGKLPSENLAPYLDISPVNHLDDIVTPLLIAATTGDKTNPLVLHVGRLVDGLRARNKTFELKVYDHAPGDHIFLFGDTDERRDLFDRIFAFLDKYMK
ncbi:MAG: alpha/beta fold hydrolase [Terriglobales bacterium]|jgi:dipeptidyl aminopeptidase/acylaminoacyl peptidase